jgi:hypothetical protein
MQDSSEVNASIQRHRVAKEEEMATAADRTGQGMPPMFDTCRTTENSQIISLMLYLAQLIVLL